MCECVDVGVYVELRNNTQELVLSFHHVSPGAHTQVVREEVSLWKIYFRDRVS